MNSHEESALIQRARQGDREALGVLWDALTPKLFGYLVNTVRDRTLAEDILQTTWLKAIEALPSFHNRGAGLSAWLFAIARNEYRERWRKSGRETAFDLLEHDRTEDKQPGLETKVLAEQILASLSEDDREVLRLRYIADLPMNDIAKILKINFVAVRVRLHRALARARTKLDHKKHE